MLNFSRALHRSGTAAGARRCRKRNRARNTAGLSALKSSNGVNHATQEHPSEAFRRSFIAAELGLAVVDVGLRPVLAGRGFAVPLAVFIFPIDRLGAAGDTLFSGREAGRF